MNYSPVQPRSTPCRSPSAPRLGPRRRSASSPRPVRPSAAGCSRVPGPASAWATTSPPSSPFMPRGGPAGASSRSGACCRTPRSPAGRARPAAPRSSSRTRTASTHVCTPWARRPKPAPHLPTRPWSCSPRGRPGGPRAPRSPSLRSKRASAASPPAADYHRRADRCGHRPASRSRCSSPSRTWVGS